MIETKDLVKTLENNSSNIKTCCGQKYFIGLKVTRTRAVSCTEGL